MIELLSPAGNKDAFYAAINAGADAIYMGIDRFNARQMAENFIVDEYIDAINYAHIFDVKVYLTLNTLIYTDEMIEVMNILLKLYNAGLDAVIVQDIGLACLIKKYFKDLPIHASTQMTIHSLKQVKYLEKLGFSRVVLARELTFDEIEYIAKNSSIELEVFIHGALCVSYSGQCLMSSMIGERSGNRGKCAGSCRLPFKLMKKGNMIDSGHLLSKKDIYGIDYVDKLIKIGVRSLKIEGRGKNKEYISLVTRKYRKYIDTKSFSKDDEKDLLQIFNRTNKSEGYFSKVGSKESISYRSAKNTGLKLGEVIDSKNTMIKIKLLEDIDMQDGIESEDANKSTIVTCIRDENKVLINQKVEKGKIVWIGDFKKAPKKGECINKTSSKKLILNEQNYILNNQRKKDVILNLIIKENEKISAIVKINDKNLDLKFDVYPQKALSKSLSKEYIEEILNKNKTELFRYSIENSSIDDNLFLRVSEINEIRRKISVSIIDYIRINRNCKFDFEKEINHAKLGNFFSKGERYETLFIYKLKQDSINKINARNEKIVYINISDIMNNSEDILKIINKDIYLYIPNVILKNLEKYIDENLESIIKHYNVKGILLGCLNYIEKVKYLKEKYNIKVIIDYSLNVNNVYSASFFKENGADIVTISPELDVDEAKKINKIIDIEIVKDMVTVMTTRYCVIKAFDKCNCKNEDYCLEDSFGKKYNIVTDTSDCITKYVRNMPRKIDIDVSYKRNVIIS